MTTQERIKRNREMEARIEARKLANAPVVAAQLDRAVKRLMRDLVRTLPESEVQPFLEAARRGFRPC